MNFEQVLGYCQAVGAKVVANDLVFRQAVPDLYMGGIKRFKARLVKNLSQPEPPKIEPAFQGAEKVDLPRPETHQVTDPAKMKLLVEVKKFERQAGLAGIDSVKFKVEELVDWRDRLERNMEALLKQRQGGEDCPGEAVVPPPTRYPRPDWRMDAHGKLRPPRQLEELCYHFQHELTAKLYQHLTTIDMVDRVSKPDQLYPFQGERKTWEEWNEELGRLVVEKCPHIDPFNITRPVKRVAVADTVAQYIEGL